MKTDWVDLARKRERELMQKCLEDSIEIMAECRSTGMYERLEKPESVLVQIAIALFQYRVQDGALS